MDQGNPPTDPVGTARRERLQEQTLREIIVAARTQLQLHGTEGVTMRAVARAIDMTPSGLYRHVLDHQELLGLVAAEACASAELAMDRARTAAPPEDHATAWYLVAMAMRQWYLDNESEAELLVSPRTVAPPPAPLRDAASRVWSLLARICTDAIDAGQLDPAAAGLLPAGRTPGPDDPALGHSIALTGAAALGGHILFEVRGLFDVETDPQERYGAYVRSLMPLMGFVVEPRVLLLPDAG